MSASQNIYAVLAADELAVPTASSSWADEPDDEPVPVYHAPLTPVKVKTVPAHGPPRGMRSYQPRAVEDGWSLTDRKGRVIQPTPARSFTQDSRDWQFRLKGAYPESHVLHEFVHVVDWQTVVSFCGGAPPTDTPITATGFDATPYKGFIRGKTDLSAYREVYSRLFCSRGRKDQLKVKLWHVYALPTCQIYVYRADFEKMICLQIPNTPPPITCLSELAKDVLQQLTLYGKWITLEELYNRLLEHQNDELMAYFYEHIPAMENYRDAAAPTIAE